MFKVASLAVAMTLSMRACPGVIGKALRLHGYTEVQPAADYWEPGTLVTVDKWQPFRVTVLCPAAKMLGEDYKPHESRTMTAEMGYIRKNAANLDVDVADIVNSKNSYEGMRNLKMTIDNPHIFDVTDYDIYSRRDRADPVCIQALKDRLADGHKVTLISSALKADVVYDVSWDRNAQLSVAAKVEALANLSGKLGAESRPQTTNKISGQGLYWGIRDDMWLAHQFLKGADAPPVERDARLIPKSIIIRNGARPAGSEETAPTPADPNGQLPAPQNPTPSPVGEGEGRSKPPTVRSSHDGAGPHAPGKRVFSVVTEEGPMEVEVDEEPEAEYFTLVAADPNERVSDLLQDASEWGQED